ncbi:hypothetical protein DUNSADRAFT_2500 [Dunaliella salina]|uniref:Uncharacterized protein n=1 Tax=Dunaliella salina TaxID=3046 RepID=A0ABQ7FW79_DUNSA|nr:hypothetical protein DUNSADRAFT_2500 [Dunaliella salina]|eukprot:KAF5826625.1 hypothetical protein DUNSADRAFT_2500 [Dunaliella salina]
MHTPIILSSRTLETLVCSSVAMLAQHLTLSVLMLPICDDFQRIFFLLRKILPKTLVPRLHTLCHLESVTIIPLTIG